MTNFLSSFWDIFGVFLHYYSPIQLIFLFASWQVPLFLSVSSNLPCISLLCRITKLKSSDLNLGEPLVSRAWHVTDKVSINHSGRCMSDTNVLLIFPINNYSDSWIAFSDRNLETIKPENSEKCFFFRDTLINYLIYERGSRCIVQWWLKQYKFALSARFLLLNCTY